MFYLYENSKILEMYPKGGCLNQLQNETPLDSVDWLSVKIAKGKQKVIIGGGFRQKLFH
jgi:hypothetical protein